MALESKLITKLEPSIELDKLKFKAYNEKEGDNPGDNNTTRDLGMEFPLVMINNYRFSQEDIVSFEIDMDGMLPTISLTVTDSRSQFTIESFPRDGDAINVRLASRAKSTYKDIRIDFDIDSVDSPARSNMDYGTGTAKFTFTGKMKVPGLFAEGCKSYGIGTTINHLESIATDLQLGLATNIDTTDDEMNLLTAYEPLSDTLSDLVKHSYVSDEAFQTFSIDPYYYINYVDLNKLLNAEESFEDSLAALDVDMNDILHPDSDETANEMETALILSSHSKLEGTNIHVRKYSLKNQSGKKVKQHGYKRILQYFENDSEEGLVSFDVEALTSEKMLDIEAPLRGRQDEERYKQEVKYKYVGRRNSDPETSNTHLNYNFAEIHNTQNIEELDKLKLEVELSSWNPAIYKWQKIPVVIFSQIQNQIEADTIVKKKKEELGMDVNKPADLDDEQSDKSAVDDFLSGFYVVGGIKYVYRKSDQQIRQRMTLLRREWPARVNNLG